MTTIRTHLKTPQNGVPFIVPLLPPQPLPFPPPKSVHLRTFSPENCIPFAIKRQILRYFQNMCRKSLKCATCPVPDTPKSPIGAQYSPGLMRGRHTPPGCRKRGITRCRAGGNRRRNPAGTNRSILRKKPKGITP